MGGLRLFLDVWLNTNYGAKAHKAEAPLLQRSLTMDELSTIQKREKLNVVRICDEKGNGGANHLYEIVGEAGNKNVSVFVQFQNGARKEEGSVHGVLDGDLLEIVRHRLNAFQAGPFNSRENAVALTHIEEALMWMNRRVEDRIERSVLGTNQK